MHEMLLMNIFNSLKKQKENTLFKNIGKEFGLGLNNSFNHRLLHFFSFQRYVAYGTTGDIDQDLKQLFEKEKVQTPRDEFIQLIENKAPMAKIMHGDRRIGPHQYLLNDLFAAGDAQTICDELENSHMIVKGNPGESFLLNHAVSFNGPMYQVDILSFSPYQSISSFL